MKLHLLSVAVFVAVILFWPTCAHAATLNGLSLVLNGPDVAQYGSTVVFKCSWLADDLVFRILWRIQLAGSSPPLEYTLKNAAQAEPVSLSSAGSESPLQGEASVDSRNNFSTLTLRNVSFVDGLYTCLVSSVTAEKLTNKSLRVVGKWKIAGSCGLNFIPAVSLCLLSFDVMKICIKLINIRSCRKFYEIGLYRRSCSAAIS